MNNCDNFRESIEAWYRLGRRVFVTVLSTRSGFKQRLIENFNRGSVSESLSYLLTNSHDLNPVCLVLTSNIQRSLNQLEVA